ncbi:citrate synthase [Patulibacter minatonensis]|uniref:citrate synthase n=1 Tax=Patulibacter minatonensis TaxID=298163 RepID=UPI000688B1CD|nr:citrate/2-methylcitrate synthase [Patulibacter minatonensis]
MDRTTGGTQPGGGDRAADGSAGRAPDETLTVAEAARRLGVKPATVYAYVSRGLLERHPSSARRATRFRRADVERLAGRARRTDRSPAVEAVVDTELTLLDPDGHLAYRGRDVVGLARHAGFERTAALLWEDEEHAAWHADPAIVAVVRRALEPLPPDTDPAVLLPVVVATVRALDPFRSDRRPEAVRAAARTVVAAFVDALPAVGRPVDERIAARLWTVLAPDDTHPGPAQLRALDAALVLMADHELAASTFASRVAASAWADPYGVVLTGLGPLGGALHGAMAGAAERLLVAAAGPGGAARALGEALAGDEVLPGFGHRVYRDRDPRADHLLGLLPGCVRVPAAAAAAGDVVRLAADRGLPAPNADLGLAALTTSLGLRPGSASTIFGLARTVGLVAHGLEEYRHRLRFRPRATYVGEIPGGR